MIMAFYHLKRLFVSNTPVHKTVATFKCFIPKTSVFRTCHNVIHQSLDQLFRPPGPQGQGVACEASSRDMWSEHGWLNFTSKWIGFITKRFSVLHFEFVVIKNRTSFLWYYIPWYRHMQFIVRVKIHGISFKNGDTLHFRLKPRST